MATVSVDAALADGPLHVAAESQGVVCLLEVPEDRCRGERGFDTETRLFGQACKAAADGSMANHFRSRIAGESAARLKVFSVNAQGVPVGFDKADPRAWPGCMMELHKDVRRFGDMHEDSVDLGPIHRSRFDGEGVHVPFTELHPVQVVGAFASPGKHGRVAIDTDHRATVPDTFGQRRQIGAPGRTSRPAPSGPPGRPRGRATAACTHGRHRRQQRGACRKPDQAGAPPESMTCGSVKHPGSPPDVNSREHPRAPRSPTLSEPADKRCC